MKGLIRKEWYSLWSQYRIHMLAMFGLGVLLPIIRDTDFFHDEAFWIYCAAGHNKNRKQKSPVSMIVVDTSVKVIAQQIPVELIWMM